MGARAAIPAPGYRDAGIYGQLGNLLLVGQVGYSWASATDNINSIDLNFGSQSLNPSSAISHGHGCQLRCLSE